VIARPGNDNTKIVPGHGASEIKMWRVTRSRTDGAGEAGQAGADAVGLPEDLSFFVTAAFLLAVVAGSFAAVILG
jgi:hypothetical protein